MMVFTLRAYEPDSKMGGAGDIWNTGISTACLSVGLYTEWQDVLTRPENLPPGRTSEDARLLLRYLASQSHLQEIHFLWRLFLRDADDDMVLELDFAAGCRHIVTHSVKDFHGSEQLGLTALTPRDFLKLIRPRT